MKLKDYKQYIARKLDFNYEDIVLLETEQANENDDPYYYLFIYKGHLYKLFFDKLYKMN